MIQFEATFETPHQVETDRLVMVYHRLDNPGRDAEAMDNHLARLEKLLGGPLRSKVYWVRGKLPFLDLENMSVHALALGSGKSPADWKDGGSLDRHELAHAAIDEFRPVSADPPFLLHEGWAESQSGIDPVELARRALDQRKLAPTLGVRQLVGPDWYHRDSGPVYPVGGAFVEYLIRTHGIEPFLRLFNECRPETFESRCSEIFGVDLDTLEARFWKDAERLTGQSG